MTNTDQTNSPADTAAELDDFLDGVDPETGEVTETEKPAPKKKGGGTRKKAPAKKAEAKPAAEGEELGGKNHPTLDADQDTRDQLKKLTDRVIELEDEKDHVAGQIKQVFAEAKAMGFDTKILRKVVRELKRSEADRQEEFRLMEMYLNALGIFW